MKPIHCAFTYVSCSLLLVLTTACEGQSNSSNTAAAGSPSGTESRGGGDSAGSVAGGGASVKQSNAAGARSSARGGTANQVSDPSATSGQGNAQGGTTNQTSVTAASGRDGNAQGGTANQTSATAAASSGRGGNAQGGTTNQTSVTAASGRGGNAQGGTTTGNPSSGGAATGGQSTSSGTATTGPTGDCRNTRLTTYADNNELIGCGYHRSLSVLPTLVRDRMYFAMAEPFYGSSYNGAPGESCGECWELTTATTTAIVMVADLCPIEGNAPCSDPEQLHFDLVEGAADRVGSEGWDQAVARPVACPVTGNIYLEVLDRSWAYFQGTLFNYRIPLRLVEYQPVGSNSWAPLTRIFGAAWHNMDDQDAAFNTTAAGADANGAGVRLRLTSAQGQVVTSSVILNASNSAVGAAVDLGVQFDNLLSVAGDACQL